MEVQEMRSKIIEAVLETLMHTSWDRLTMETLAKKLALTPVQLYHVFPTRCELLKGIVHFMDDKMIKLYQEGEANLPLQEKLFDIIMCRFEVMEPYKKSLKNIIFAIWRDPLSFPEGILSGLQSMTLILKTVDVPVDGIKGRLNIKILSLFYLYALKFWFEDESQDMAKTLAHVDKGLKNIINLLNV